MAKPSWITISPTSGTGNSDIEVTAAENVNFVNRSGVIEVTGEDVTKSVSVSQMPGGFYLKEVAYMGNTRPPSRTRSFNLRIFAQNLI